MFILWKYVFGFSFCSNFGIFKCRFYFRVVIDFIVDFYLWGDRDRFSRIEVFNKFIIVLSVLDYSCYLYNNI